MLSFNGNEGDKGITIMDAQRKYNVLLISIMLITFACTNRDFKNPIDPDYSANPPYLISPPDRLIINDGTPTFIWQIVEGASGYGVQVDNNVAFSSPEVDSPVLTDTSFVVNDTLSDGLYFWRVRARFGEDAWKDWSDSRQITIDTRGPRAPNLISPLNGSTIVDNIPTFDWSDVNGAVTYELEVDNSSSFINPNINQTNLISSTYTPTGSLSDGTWYWRVRCQDYLGNWGTWSSISRFNIIKI
jgi:hypothetical protein